MPSYSTSLKLELMDNGSNSNSWGTVTNTNLGTTLEQAIVGRADITMSSTTITLSLTDSNAAQDARAIYLNLTGSPGGAAELRVPAVQKPYIVKNGSDQQVTVKVAGLTGVVVPVGKTVLVYNNGTDVVTAVDHIPSLTLGAALPVASGGTGATTLTGVVRGNGTSAFTAGNVNLASEVTGTLPVANGGTGISAFGTGVAAALGQNVTGSGGIALGISSGTYTPTLTSVANVVSTTAETCMYTNVQGVVTVYGRFGIQFNSGTVQVGISLPIASDFTSSNNCIGFPTIVLSGVILAYPPFIYIKADTTNNRADLYYRANSGVTGSDSEMYFNFAYRVI